jgi:hypothetical protein
MLFQHVVCVPQPLFVAVLGVSADGQHALLLSWNVQPSALVSREFALFASMEYDADEHS